MCHVNVNVNLMAVDATEIKSKITKCRYECKNGRKHNVCKKYYIWNTSTRTCENGEYLENVIDDSVVRCDEIIDAVQSELINFNTEKAACKMDNFYFLLAFVLTTILLLITVDN